VIASDLRVSESTVKVHIHNVMRKLHVSNRTEAVIKIGELATDVATDSLATAM
jgi:DNA-binding NarL/FixJ family response regulator